MDFTIDNISVQEVTVDGDIYRVTDGSRPNRLVYYDAGTWRYVSDDTAVS
jgi:hypothetical protein